MKYAFLLICFTLLLLTAGAMHWEYLHRNDRTVITVTVPR